MKFWENLKGVIKTNAVLLFLPAVVRGGFDAIPEEWVKAEIAVLFWSHRKELSDLAEKSATPIDDSAIEDFDAAAKKWLESKGSQYQQLPYLLDGFVQIGQ